MKKHYTEENTQMANEKYSAQLAVKELEIRSNRGQASEEEIAACMSAEIMCLASMTHGL